MTADVSRVWSDFALDCGAKFASTPAADVLHPSAAAPYPSIEDAAWRGHSHGSERKCDTTCWSEPLDKVLNPDGEPCAQCGRVARGSTWIDGKRFCHGDRERPSCYEREQWKGQGDRALDPTPAAPTFICLPDADDIDAIWSVPEDGPDRYLLGRDSLGPSPEADALWALIVTAVEAGAR